MKGRGDRECATHLGKRATFIHLSIGVMIQVGVGLSILAFLPIFLVGPLRFNSVECEHDRSCLSPRNRGSVYSTIASGRTFAELVGGILEMDVSDGSNGIRYHVFNIRPHTELNAHGVVKSSLSS